MLCGREVSVASTKAFVSSIFFFYCLFNNEILFEKILYAINKVIKDEKTIYDFAKKIKDYNFYLFYFYQELNSSNIFYIVFYLDHQYQYKT